MRVTLVLAGLLLASLWASLVAPDALALDRAALLEGELWRLWTGHLVHWSVEHFVWDAVTFAVLGWLLAKLSWRAFRGLLLVGAPVIAVAVLLGEPAMEVYGGLSGLDVALWAAACVVVTAKARDRMIRSVGGLAFVGGLVKVAVEVASGNATFLGGNLSFVASAHVAGLVVGLLIAAVWVGRHLETDEFAT